MPAPRTLARVALYLGCVAATASVVWSAARPVALPPLPPSAPPSAAFAPVPLPPGTWTVGLGAWDVSSHAGTEHDLRSRLQSNGTHTPTDPVSDLERAALEWANESPTVSVSGPFRVVHRDLPDGVVRLVTDGERVRLAQVVRTSPDGGLVVLEVACRGAAANGGHGGLPVPAGLKPIAVRVGLDGRATAALAGPAPVEAAVAAWKADGWAVGGTRVLQLTRGTEAAIAWAIPASKGRDESYFLIAPARAGVNPNPGSSR